MSTESKKTSRVLLGAVAVWLLLSGSVTTTAGTPPPGFLSQT